MTDDGGVLGNLPNSRPGRRSAKRSESPPPASKPPPAAAEGAERDAGDPVGDAIRTATGIAATGARVANGVVHELVRRLPRL